MSFGILLDMSKMTPSGTPEPLQGFLLQVLFDLVALLMECLLCHKSLVQYYSSTHCHHIEFVGFFPLLTLQPHKIIFYRDGVSEGPLSQVLMHEIDSIRKGCVSLEDGSC